MALITEPQSVARFLRHRSEPPARAPPRDPPYFKTRRPQVVRGSARLGAGTVNVMGGAPLRGFALGAASLSIRAHGGADKLRIDLTSDPALAQDDIFLLITVGLIRAELDQAQ